MNGNEDLLALREIYRERVIPENKRFKQRCVLFSAESLKENHQHFWKEIFLFNYSGGDRNRSTEQARDSEFDEFLQAKRFSDASGPHENLKKLLQYTKEPKEERLKKLKLATFAGIYQRKEIDDTPQTLSPLSSYIRPPTFLEEILDIQLHSMWLEKTTDEFRELKLLFPNEKVFKEEISKSDAAVQEFAKDEAKTQIWLNICSSLLEIFEKQAASVFKLYQDFVDEVERKMTDNEENYGISAGTTNEFKLWLNEEVKKPDHLNPLSEENFTRNLSSQIPQLTRLATTNISNSSTKNVFQEPYRIINHSILKKIIPVLLKIRCFLEGKDEMHDHLSSLLEADSQIVDVTLADVFKKKISVEMNSKWLNSSLEEIEIRYVHEDFDPELYPLPDWLPDLKNLYTFLLATLARYPMTLCRHVLKKFESVSSSTFDHSNFVAEFNPVFDQCALTIFCVENLKLTKSCSSTDLLFNTMFKLKNDFKEALKCNFQKVLVPPQEHLRSGDFDLHQYLRRINNFSLYPIPAESIGRVLQFEMKHFKDLSRGMHISTKPKMIEFFQDNALVMMEVLNDWIKEGTIVKQHRFAEKVIESLKSQQTDETKKLVQQMIHSFRSETSTFVDNEADGIFKFSYFLKDLSENAIGYSVNKKVDFSRVLMDKNFCILRVTNDEDSDFWIFCQEETIQRFVNGKSTYLEELFDQMQSSDFLSPVTKELLKRIDNNENAASDRAFLSTIVDPNRGKFKMLRRAYFDPGSFSIDVPDEEVPNLYQQKSQTTRTKTLARQKSVVEETEQSELEEEDSILEDAEEGENQRKIDIDWREEDSIFVVRKSVFDKLDWKGKVYEIAPNSMALTPVFAVEMEKNCDCYIVTKDINNENIFSNVFQDSLELVVKQIGITNEARKMVENLRQSISKITLSLKNIVKEHFAIFQRLKDWFLEIHKSEGEKFKLKETLDYFRKEFPNGTRRLYESLNFLFLSVMGRFTRKPYNMTVTDDPFYQSFQRITLEILHEWTLFETMISSTRSFETIKNNLRRGPISMENEHLDIHFLRSLGEKEADKYSESLKRIIDALENRGNEPRVARPKRIFSQESVDQRNTSRTTFQKKCRESIAKLESRILKKSQSLPREERIRMGIGRVFEDSAKDSEESESTLSIRIFSHPIVIGRSLGRGGFGEVSFGIRRDTGDQLAVKQILGRYGSPDAKKIASLKAAIETECIASEKLHHKNIVTYFGFKIQSNDILQGQMIYEYCELDLQKEIYPNGLAQITIQSYALQLIEAVEYMHSNGWVHRDIKPGNILLSPRRDHSVLKLADLGSALALDEEIIDHPDSAIGCTMNYAPPEVIKGRVGMTSDIWSIGCTVLEMITQKLPWTADGNPEKYLAFFQCQFGEKSYGIKRWGNPLEHYKKNKGRLETFFGSSAFILYAENFMNRCFDQNPETRITASELKNHAFLGQIATFYL